VGLVAPALAVAAGPGWLRNPEGRFLAALLVPFAVLALVFYPPEGLFRFWDIFAGLGVALSLFTAWLAAGVLEHQQRRSGLAVALALGVMCPSLAWMIHNANADPGVERVQAYLREPPARAPALRATAHEFLGFRLIDLGRPAEAAIEFRRAAEIVPSPRVLRQWATAETMSGDLAAAQSVWQRIVERDSTNLAGWRSLAASSMQLGDTSEAVRSLETLVRLDPRDSTARRLLRQLGH